MCFENVSMNYPWSHDELTPQFIQSAAFFFLNSLEMEHYFGLRPEMIYKIYNTSYHQVLVAFFMTFAGVVL